MAFDGATLENLLNMAEGPALDFKREQYRFDRATKNEKSELLKDILAFANSSREGTAHILIGVEEAKGAHTNKVVGIHDHLKDASLHQFVNSKTNRPLRFSCFAFPVKDKEIGVISIPIQDRPVYIGKSFGKLSAGKVYMRDGSSTRCASPDEIAAMGRGNPPQWAIDTLRSLSCNAVITTTRQWREHPHRFREFGPQRSAPSYEESRAFALGRSHLPEDYVDGIDSYGSLHWVFEGFEKLASDCVQMFRTVGSGLAEHGSLIRAMTRLERVVESEKIVWDEFRKRTGHPNSPLPLEAGYNLLVIAELTVRLVDVIDSDNLDGDTEYEAHRRFAPEVIRRSDQWGEWRR